jgi:hypothetical protein
MVPGACARGSGASLGDEAGGGAQRIGLRAERRQRVIGLGHQSIEAGCAPARPKVATSVALPAAASLWAALPMVLASPYQRVAHSILTFAAFISGHHFSISAF